MNEKVDESLANARAVLLGMRNEQGYWEGELSTSALSTATSIVALGSVDEVSHQRRIEAACNWLIENQNEDGGWGDTTKSFSNISTTLLCWSALSRFGSENVNRSIETARNWIYDYVGSLEPGAIVETVKARYGKDRTFSVPILMHCAICGTLGDRGWRHVLRLPFELAVFPRRWYAALRFPVVSYALPALIAIGYAGHRQHTRGLKHPFWARVSKLLIEIQPASGGFLEAAPLTGFVIMALVAAGERNHPVARKGVEFLIETVRPDGSWPIDTNLATWSTTLAVKAIFQKGTAPFDPDRKVLDWLLQQQYREVHPFTASPPGGWAWTDLSGGVPDADDTPGALLALHVLGKDLEEVSEAAISGIVWLLDLQNRDGGIPTFCRGWGALPFDRSSPDLTAHSLRAWKTWRSEMPRRIRNRIDAAEKKAIRYLKNEQRNDGSWTPLWFGNQHRNADEENPTYGTAMVVRALDDIGYSSLADAGAAWLLAQQNCDGGWGSKKDSTPSTIEESALAVSTLAVRPEAESAVERGVEWLLGKTNNGTEFDPAPIGFYFAKLWYYERSYPVVWTVEALSRITSE